MTQATRCWCLSCEPKTGEIGLECKKDKTPTTESPMRRLLLNQIEVMDAIAWGTNVTRNRENALRSAIKDTLKVLGKKDV